MNKFKSFFIFIVFLTFSLCANAQNVDENIQQLSADISFLREEVSTIQESQNDMRASIVEQKSKQRKLVGQISLLEEENSRLQGIIDSIKTDFSILSDSQKQDREQLGSQIDDTKEGVKANQELLSYRTNVGTILIVIILIIIIAVSFIFNKKYKKGTDSVEEVRQAQKMLEQAQKSLQEESVKLDNKLLEIVELQIKQSAENSQTTKPIGHSLALKVADEIVRIELNLSRMDASIKGYKQLSKAVQRIKDNFLANGYEIVDMLGKPYVTGMKAAVTFITDESIAKGQQIITKVIKPQINYQQQMIQAAQIEVSQPE